MSGRRTRPARSPTSRCKSRRHRLYRARPGLRGGRFLLLDAACTRGEFATMRASFRGARFSMTEPHDLTAVELLARYRAKSLSPSEVFADIEKHIARWEPHLKALYAYDPDAARVEAKASTDRWANG